MYRTVLFSLAIAGTLTSVVTAEPVRGYYLEVRADTCRDDVDIANTAVGAVGYAVLGWEVNHGEFHGVRLDGLSAVALVEANGDREDPPADMRVRLLISDKATLAQRDALVGMVRQLAPAVMRRVADITSAKIDLAVYQGCSRGYAKLETGPIAIKTRRVLDCDRGLPRGQRYSPMSRLFYQYPAWTAEFTSVGDGTAAVPVPALDRGNQATALVGGFWVEPAASDSAASDTVATIK